jgi:hypothetical protein
VLYTDYQELFNELSDEDSGKLIKHIFFVNDENPTTDKIIQISFIPIKLQLKKADLISQMTKKFVKQEKASVASKRLLEAYWKVQQSSTNQHLVLF